MHAEVYPPLPTFNTMGDLSHCHHTNIGPAAQNHISTLCKNFHMKGVEYMVGTKNVHVLNDTQWLPYHVIA